mmetsp:Transcript_39099/g.125711  ORF Transcript_39099/g.125711 Transcript_39099/m.125711 type:complete len:283 (-) Transcript_39099:57-905(-)
MPRKIWPSSSKITVRSVRTQRRKQRKRTMRSWTRAVGSRNGSWRWSMRRMEWRMRRRRTWRRSRYLQMLVSRGIACGPCLRTTTVERPRIPEVYRSNQTTRRMRRRRRTLLLFALRGRCQPEPRRLRGCQQRVGQCRRTGKLALPLHRLHEGRGLQPHRHLLGPTTNMMRMMATRMRAESRIRAPKLTNMKTRIGPARTGVQRGTVHNCAQRRSRNLVALRCRTKNSPHGSSKRRQEVARQAAPHRAGAHCGAQRKRRRKLWRKFRRRAAPTDLRQGAEPVG